MNPHFQPPPSYFLNYLQPSTLPTVKSLNQLTVLYNDIIKEELKEMDKRIQIRISQIRAQFSDENLAGKSKQKKAVSSSGESEDEEEDEDESSSSVKVKKKAPKPKPKPVPAAAP